MTSPVSRHPVSSAVAADTAQGPSRAAALCHANTGNEAAMSSAFTHLHACDGAFSTRETEMERMVEDARMKARRAQGDNAEFLETVGRRVRSARAARRMSRRMLCEASGVSQRFIAHLEHGEGNISIVRLKAIADALGVPVAALITDMPAPAERTVSPAAIADLYNHAGVREQRAVAELLTRRGNLVPA